MNDLASVNLTLEQSRQQLEHLDKLLQDPAWKFFKNEILQARKTGMEREVAGMNVATMEDVARFNKMQGRIAELTILPHILEGIRNDLYNGVQKLQDQLEGQDDDN